MLRHGQKVLLLVLPLVLLGCVNNANYIALENLPSNASGDSTAAARTTSGSASRSTSTPQSTPPSQQAAPSSEPAPDSYVVQSGDTLYSIAFRYSRDFRDVAAVNNIREPFTIVPGQRIDLRSRSTSASASSSRPSPSSRAREQTAPSGGRSAASNNGTASSSAPSGSGSGSSSQAPSVVDSPPRQITATPLPAEPADAGAVAQWLWPVNGSILRNFSEGASGSKGIDIEAPMGESVQAAADGRVVYAGDGLRGYGNLIILEHAGRMLSAYAFTSVINVEEQQRVKQGDVIAEVGSRGSTPLLHFEIREEGKPVDPMRYLPPR